jgi:CheY-like chemotaxis protein
MESFSHLLSALSSLAWPAIFAAMLFKFSEPLKKLIESARGRKFTIKVAGNELTMEEASEQQRLIVSDIQSKLAELEKRLSMNATEPLNITSTPMRSSKHILWVDDRPKNNSFLVASLGEQGVKIDIALSTEEGVEKFKTGQYDMVISDMGRPEGEKAGIDLAKKIRMLNTSIPFFIFCGSWAARNLKEESINAGVTHITSSGTSLLSVLPLSNGS